MTNASSPADLSVVYKAIWLIKDMVHTYAKESNGALWLDPLNDKPNAFYCQTESGLFLELYYGLPNTLWTPWGKFRIGGSGSGHWSATTAMIVERLGGVIHRHARHIPTFGELGAVYALSKVDDLPLPPAVVRPVNVEYEESNRSWLLEGNRT